MYTGWTEIVVNKTKSNMSDAAYIVNTCTVVSLCSFNNKNSNLTFYTLILFRVVLFAAITKRRGNARHGIDSVEFS